MNLPETFWTHRKTLALARLLCKGAEVLPLRLWAHVSVHHGADGRLAGYTAREIEQAAGWWGEPGRLVAALESVGWLDRLPEGNGWQCHEWATHQPALVRAEDAEQRVAALVAAALQGWQQALAATCEQERKDRELDARLALARAERDREHERERKARQRAAHGPGDVPPMSLGQSAECPGDVPSDYSSTSNNSNTDRKDLNRVFDAMKAAAGVVSAQAQTKPAAISASSSNETALRGERSRTQVPAGRDTFGTGLPKNTAVKPTLSKDRERKLMGELRQMLGDDEMARKGAVWRLKLREDADLLVAIMVDVQAMIKEGEKRDNWAAYMETLWKDWKQKRKAGK